MEEKKETPIEEAKEEKVEPVPVQPTENAEQPEKPEEKKKKKGTAIIIVCVVIIVVAILGTLAVVLLKGQATKGKAEVNKPVQASPYQLSGNGLEQFDLYFLQLENKQENIIYSPLSIKYVLAMLNEGTAGNSHEQIRSVIGDYKAKKYNNNEHMSFGNAMYINQRFKDGVKKEYVDNLKEKYGADVIIDPFTSPEPINTWISDRTFHLINNLLQEPIDDYDFFLVNALAIDMNWNYQLQCETTQARTEGKVKCKYYTVNYAHENYSDSVRDLEDSKNYDSIDFNGKKAKSLELGASINNYDIIKELGEDNIRKTVGTKLQEYIDNGGEMCGYTYDEFMNNYIKELGDNYKQVDYSTDFYLYDNSELKAFAKDLQTYDGTTLQYVAIMPKEKALDAYIKDLDAKSVNEIIKELKDMKAENFKEGVVTKIRGHIPVFKYEYKLQLKEDLQELGIKDVFSAEKADLSKMVKTKGGEYIEKADHKAVIDFSNDGIKAAAVTLAGGKGAASCETFDYEYEVPVETIDISFNKPYVYLIRDKDTGEVWFVGSVYTPTEQ